MRPLLAFASVATLGWLTSNAVRIGSAQSLVHDATRETATWTASHSRPASETIGWVEDDLLRAVALFANDPAAHELLGTMKLRRADSPEYMGGSLVYFGRALELRPTSPYTWANIAEAKYQIGDTGEVFAAALERAAQMGPAEPEVQRTVIDLGLAVWKEVAAKTRSSIERAVAAAMKRNPMETLQIAERRGRLDVACRHLADSARRTEPKWPQFCPNAEATP
jgi:hypothetical protein